MSRLTLVVVALFMLAGCESDFQKCMNAEVPRAKKTLMIEQEAAKLTQLPQIRDQLSAIIEIVYLETKYKDVRPAPKGPKREDFEVFDDWIDARNVFRQESAYLTWKQAKDDYLLNAVIETGLFKSQTLDELQIEQKSAFDTAHLLLLPRAQKYDCWGNDDCENSLGKELESTDFDDENTELARKHVHQVIENAFSESIVMQTEKLSSLNASVKDLATVTCNSNGLYE